MERENIIKAVDLILMNWDDRCLRSVKTSLYGRILTLVGLPWERLLQQISLLEWILFVQKGLPGQILLALTHFVGWTLIALRELLF